MLKRSARLAVGCITSAVLVGVLAPAAFAHVEVSPGEAAQGTFTKLAFSVPNERDTASTIKLEVTFPTDHPIAFVSVKPHVGWTATVDKTKLAKPITMDTSSVTDVVSKITWSAASPTNAIKPGEFDEFEVSAGPLPADTNALVFKVLQTYEGGEIVRWIEATPAGGPEPAHPAPVLTLTAAAASASTGAHGSTAAPATSDSATSDSATSDSTTSDSTKTVAFIALGVAVVALLIGLAAVLRRPRGKAPAHSGV